MQWIELIWRGLCAGLSIGLGGFLFIITLFIKQILNADVVEKLFKLVGSVLFSVGLYMVCMLNLQLYTGKIGLIYTIDITCNVVGQLCVMLMFNLIGSGGLGYACYWIFKQTKIIDVVNNIATTRITITCFNDYLTSLINSILCGACVFMAVKCYQTKRKLLLMVFIAWFVFCGYEHCIADAFYYTFANAFTLNALLSIIINIVGNTIGPGLVFYIWTDVDDSDVNNYDHDNYDHNSYDHNGSDVNNYDHNSYDHNGSDVNNYDHNSYDHNGSDVNNYDHNGSDVNNYDVNNYNHNGSDVNNYDVNNYNHNGSDVNNYDVNNYDVNRYDHNGSDVNNYDVDGGNANSSC